MAYGALAVALAFAVTERHAAATFGVGLLCLMGGLRDFVLLASARSETSIPPTARTKLVLLATMNVLVGAGFMCGDGFLMLALIIPGALCLICVAARVPRGWFEA